MPICPRCRAGFDVAGGAAPVCPRCGAVWSPATAEGGAAAARVPLSNLILFAAALICVLGCVAAVLKTIYGLATLQPVFSVVGMPAQTAWAMRLLILLDGAVWFTFCAALTIVFVRVQRIP